MKNIDKKTVEYVVHLARIELRSQQLEKLCGQLENILRFIDKLKEIDVENTPPTSHILPISNVFRADELKESLPIDKTLENAPDREGRFFGVPKVIE